ncbi:hypothetical protein HPB51_005754 [Rhipicephalus microplus]|uniref:Uncharacterized protein n=1 Tax=Rhipicephalus microplus TaxID=6941 RepID=A0A9J6DT19_RHIMP|nr:hypothetical protein HPB51_005754 [Rhipicephalus microplus]
MATGHKTAKKKVQRLAGHRGDLHEQQDLLCVRATTLGGHPSSPLSYVMPRNRKRGGGGHTPRGRKDRCREACTVALGLEVGLKSEKRQRVWGLGERRVLLIGSEAMNAGVSFTLACAHSEGISKEVFGTQNANARRRSPAVRAHHSRGAASRVRPRSTQLRLASVLLPCRRAADIQAPYLQFLTTVPPAAGVQDVSVARVAPHPGSLSSPSHPGWWFRFE